MIEIQTIGSPTITPLPKHVCSEGVNLNGYHTYFNCLFLYMFTDAFIPKHGTYNEFFFFRVTSFSSIFLANEWHACSVFRVWTWKRRGTFDSNSDRTWSILHQLDWHQVDTPTWCAPSRLHQVNTAPSRNFTITLMPC